MRIDFKGAHYPKAVIVHAVFFYVRYAVSYRDLEEILAERGVSVDHAPLVGRPLAVGNTIELPAINRQVIGFFATTGDRK